MDTSRLQGWRSKKDKIPQETISQNTKVVKKTNTQEIEKNLEEFKTLKKANLPNMVKAW